MKISKQTIYIGHDAIEYDAVAEYDTVEKCVIRYDVVNEDGSFTATGERDWDQDSIELTFFGREE